MSNCGSRFKKVWELDKNGYLKQKKDKNGKQEVVDLHQDIQDHFGEVDFKSKLEQNKEAQNDVMTTLNLQNIKKDGKVFDDVNNTPFVDLMTNIVKLKNTFVDENGNPDVNWYKRVNKFLLERKAYYENLKKEKSSEKSKVEVKKVEDNK